MMSPLTSLSVLCVMSDLKASVGLLEIAVGAACSLFVGTLLVVCGREKGAVCRGKGMGTDGDC